MTGSPQEPVWRRQNPDGWKIQKSLSFTTGTTEAHQMATRQDYGMLQKLLDAQEHLVNAADTNGWTPLHESLTGNSEAILELLIEKGSDVNAKTKDGRTPLELAKYFKGEGHPFVKILQDAGARMDGGEL